MKIIDFLYWSHSAVAGRMSIQAGAHSLENFQGGRGLLIGGAPGVNPGNVLILGGGVVGEKMQRLLQRVWKRKSILLINLKLA